MKSFSCPRCALELPADTAADGTLENCLRCRVPLRITVLPAAAEVGAPTSIETPASPGDAACFYHAARRAAIPCDRCGRFLCTLCDLPTGGVHLCPPCLEFSLREGQPGPLEPRRLRPDLIAGYLLLIGLLSCGLLFPITGLAAVVIAWGYRNAPPSLVDPSAFRLRLMMAAGVLSAGIGIPIWLWLIVEAPPRIQQYLSSP